MKLVAKSLLIATIAALATSVAVAAQRRMPLEMLCRHAERIVIAEVTAARVTEADWPGVGSLTTTVFTLKVEETWKGATSTTIELEAMGGTDPKTGLTLTVSGAPVFRVGERALIFVDDVNGVSRVYGWTQGKYELIVKRVVGRAGMPIDEDILTHPLKKRIDVILAAQAAETPKETGSPEEPGSTGSQGGGR